MDRWDLEASLARAERECCSCSAFPLDEFCEKGFVWGSQGRMPGKEADAVQLGARLLGLGLSPSFGVRC